MEIKISTSNAAFKAPEEYCDPNLDMWGHGKRTRRYLHEDLQRHPLQKAN